MNTLSETWFVEGYIDFELKKYTLLAYLQKVNALFNEQKLYPQLSDLIMHYDNLIKLKEGKQKLQENFPKKLTGIQLEQLRLLYEEIVKDDELMEELQSIILYSIEKLGSTIQSGKDLYNTVEEKIEITPVGIQPLDVTSGYFFLTSGHTSSTTVYQYQLTIFENANDTYRGLMTHYLFTHKKDLSHTYESIKLELIKNNLSHDLPAVYAIEAKVRFPEQETLLPIAKRTLIRHVSS
ncbi:MAG TPA: hypothetical protein VL947_04890 [Cytophagales bacterium]|nr:hypothetical protein [Cytophagales bacterium]